MSSRKFALRPSSSSRWLKCPSSVVLELNASDRSNLTGFSHSDMGTAAHQLLEWCLLEIREPSSYIGVKIDIKPEGDADFGSSFIVDEDMADNIQLFLDTVEFGKDPESTVYPEIKLQHSLVPELRGTSDYVEIKGTHGKFFDYKNGTAPVIVRHRDGSVNTQLMCYASLGFDAFPELETAELAVVQPRIKTKKKVRSTEITREETEVFMDRVKNVAAEVMEMLANRKPVSPVEGGYCWYCKANKICPIKVQSQIDRDFG